jgi:predicted nucleotidyltransferase
MLDALFGSKARVALLARLLLHPQDELHLSDLFRKTGFAPRSIQLEADRLVSLGLLRERRSGNRRYLSANIGHNLYAPLRQLLERTVGVAPVLRKVLGGDERITRAVVYGSQAAGEARHGSDIDLLIVGSTTLQEVLAITSPLQERFNLEINPVVMSEEEFRARRASQEHFISSVLDGPVLPLIGDLHDPR